MSPRIPKGQTVPLNVTQKSSHRVFVGLGWDPNEDISMKDKALGALGLKDTHHDLDLSCYIYDQNKRYITHISHETGHEADQTGKIYHSGDNVEGVGDGDDEQISIELKGLDPAIDAIVFKASIKTDNVFKDVTDPEIRIADGYSDHNFLHVSLKEGDTAVFVFACLKRSTHDDNPDAWTIHHIGEFIKKTKDSDWPEILKTYIA